MTRKMMLMGRSTKSAEQKKVIVREKVKFKTKIRKMKWSKRMEEQNMKFEIN